MGNIELIKKLGSFLTWFFGSFAGMIKDLIGFALAYYVGYKKGKEDLRLEAKGEALDDAIKSAKDKNNISTISDDALNNIVFTNNDTKGSSDI